jgi:2-oxoglutarate ferredoxin oxidoreductase subunit alpha
LKSEAINLAIIYELPLIVVDVQRGGPSTGLPTKTEQSDLNMAMFGRNGDSPLIIVAPKTPSDCFKMAFEAARLSLEHMTPVIILSDGYLANGSQPWKLPDLDKDFPKINTKFADPANYTEKQYHPYERDENHVRKWAIPGMENLMHRVGGLEKEKITGNVSYDPINHEDMVRIRREKVELASNNIPEQDLFGNAEGELLIVSWGGTYGSTLEAVTRAQANGHSVSLMHMQYLSPMPKNVEIILKGFKKIVVCELNDGQLLPILNAKYGIKATGYNKIQGKPFMIRELTGLIESQIGVVS